MSKIYCKNCVGCFYKTMFDGLKPKRQYPLTEYIDKPHPNRNYDCPYYKRKWWKIWE